MLPITLSEIENAQKQKINWDNNELMVTNSSKGTRAVFLSTLANNLLKQYIESRKDDCKELFATERSKPYRKLGSRSIEEIIKNVVSRTTLKETISTKTFRHTFAQNMHDKGCPINTLQTLLGNKDLSSTSETYLKFKLTSENKKKIYQQLYK